MTEPMEAAGAATLRRAYVAIEELKAKLDAARRAASEPIAVVGLGCRFPGGASSPDAYWSLLRDGVDAIVEVPPDRWDVDAYYDPDPDVPGKTATRWGGFLDRVGEFDGAFFGISPREAVALDPQQRLLLEVVWEALEDAAIAPDRLSDTRTGVFVGIASGDYGQIVRASGAAALDAYYASGNAHSMAAGRLSYVLGLLGPSLTVDTACSSSLVAVHLACGSLRAGECRTALAAGVHLTLTPDNTIAFSKARMLAADGRCKTFDARGDGFVEGEGCGVVVLKRLSDAVAAGDRVLALIRGSAVNQDGPSAGLTAPSGPAQEAVVREALSSAGVAPADVAYVEAHGTGTALGDPIELRALAATLGRDRAPERPLLIGSVKTNVGHLEAAAGIAGLIKVVLAISKGEIPPHLHFSEPNPHVRWEALPLEVVTRRQPWPEGRRIAGVSSFGFSGTNAHVVLDAPATADATVATIRPANVLTLSAKTSGACAALADRFIESLADAAPFDSVCHSAAVGRAWMQHRLAVIAPDAATAREKLSAWRRGDAPPGVVEGRTSPGTDPPRVAMLFTGQGAQYAGMGRDLYDTSDVFRAAIDDCARVLADELDVPLLELLYGNASDRLDATRYTQPALFAVEWALLALWRSFGVEPALVMGHSIGELVAAAAGSVMPLDDALRLVAARGRLMQALPAGGGMLAVAADEAAVRSAMRGDVDLEIAGINGPADVVVSGGLDAIAQLEARLRDDGVRSRRLSVSHAFHSRRMEPMLDTFERAAADVELRAPRVGLVSNVTGAVANEELTTARYWREHVRAPVRFAAGITTLAAAGVDAFLEIGPAPTLIGLGSRCIDDASLLWLPSLRQGRDAWSTLLESAARLWARGAPVEPIAFAPPTGRIALPTYPWERRRFWPVPAPARADADRADAAGAHPLLGRRIASPLAAAHFESLLSADAPAFLRDHRIGADIIAPGVAYLEMMRTAAVAHAGSRASLEDITFTVPLVVPDEGVRLVHTVVTVDADARATVRVLARRVDADDWTTHAAATIATIDDERDATSTALHVHGDAHDSAAFYELLAGRGLVLGPGFRAVVRASSRDGEVLASLRLPDTLDNVHDYGIHPVLLDASIQAIAAAIGRDMDAMLVPVAVERFRLLRTPGTTAECHVEVRPEGDGLRADVRLFDDAGTIARLQGLRLRRMDRRDDVDSSASAITYEVRWQPAPLAPCTPPDQVDDRVAREMERWTCDPDLVRYGNARAVLDQLSVDHIVRALRALGASLVPGAVLRTDALDVAPRYARLLERWYAILAEDGIVARTSDGWTVLREPSEEIAAAAGDRASCVSVAGAELALLTRCGPRLAEVLRDACDPLELLFPGGSLELAEPLYHESPPARAAGGIVGAIVRAALDRLPDGRRLRILEVGGGTGGTTASVLQALPAGRYDYLFTDISPRFVARAAERFGGVEGFRTAILDIERDDDARAIVGGDVDIIIAANVLHATAELRRTVTRCGSLLGPGGSLVAVEVTVPQRWVDVTFGLTDGWWRFTDTELRSAHPLLDAGAWSRLLRETGFPIVHVLPDPAFAAGALAQQAVLLATKAVAERSATVIVPDATGIGARLAERLREHGERVVVAAPSQRDQYAIGAAIQTVADASVRPRLVDLRALDESEDEGDPYRVALRAVELLRAVGEASPPGAGVVFASRGAQHVDGDGAPALAQTPLLGIARSARIERPELDCTLIDLDPHAAADPVAAIVAELRSGSDESESAWRGGLRMAPRLRRTDAPPPADGTVCLVRGANGGLDELRLEPLARRAPGAGEVEVCVRAATLNFKDVLGALDAAGEVMPLGSECAGTVVAVGAGVTHVRPGDDVVALAAGCHADFVTTSADLVWPKPSALSFAQAAALPIAAVTATIALCDVAQLAAGDRVLVHSAAGGVGLAAVRLAQTIGAEVVATAGTAAKRAFLQSLGVRHVFDSRSADFGREVQRLGGVDVVLNALSGPMIDASLIALRHGGRFVEIGRRGIRTGAEMAAARPDVEYAVVDWSDTVRTRPHEIARRMRATVDDAASGRVALPPVTTVPLRDAAAAYRHMAKGEHIGRIVLVSDASESVPCVRGDATYLITGGFGGLGLETAKWLAAQGARALVLLGRSAPGRNADAAISALEAEGVRVRVVRADVTDAGAIARLVRDLAHDMPPLRGIVHAAGGLADALLAEMTATHVRDAMAARVDGARALDAATRALPLDFFVLYSSIAAPFGAPGQMNHAAASAWLDGFAHARRAAGMHTLAIDWGAWADVGAAAAGATARRVGGRGLRGMTPDDALEAMGRLISSGTTHVAVFDLDWSVYATESAAGRASLMRDVALPSRAPHQRATSGTQPAVADSTAGLRQRIRGLRPAERHASLVEHIARRAARVLALDEDTPIDPDRALKELGVDSLMAVELRNLLRADLALENGVPATLVFDHPTVDAIARFIGPMLEDGTADAAASDDGEATSSSTKSDINVLDRIEELSDEDVERLLGERLGSSGA